MLKKAKRALVKSFVGAIALGWIFAQAIMHFGYMFATPVGDWLTRRFLPGLTDRQSTSFGFQAVLPEFFNGLLLLVVGYLLLRWLYFKPLPDEADSLPQQAHP